MPTDQENPNAHEPALSRQHDAGVRRETLSPAERALAPESTAPMQSANGNADDGTYVGRGGGYAGGTAPAAKGPIGHVDPANARGDSTYGYPAGPGVGMPGGEHQPAAQRPDVLVPQYPER
jgi:hypothetical protein